jgi:peptidoglycan hydrolase-like protein with peptidoglycan-binding domain
MNSKKLLSQLATLGYDGMFDPAGRNFIDLNGNPISIGSIDEGIVRRGLLSQSLTESFGYTPTIKESTGDTSELTQRTYMFWEGGNTLLELHLYYNNKGLLQEYKWKDFKKDANAVGAGAASGLTLGYSDNIVAGLKAMYKNTSYADELKNELEKTEKIKDSSPYLYMAGNVIGATALTAGSGGWATAGVIAAQAGSDAFIRNPMNSKTLANREAELAKNPAKKDAPAANVPAANVPTPKVSAGAGMSGAPDPAVSELQTALSKAGFQLTAHGIDGRFGPETVNAVKEYTKKNGGTDADSIAKLTNIVVAESIIFSSMTEAERMTYLKNKLSKLDEENVVMAAADSILGKLIAKYGLTASARGAQSLVKIFGPEAEKGVTVMGQRWVPQLGQEGKIWSNGAGKTIPVEDLAKFAAKENPSGVATAAAQSTAKPTVTPNRTIPAAANDEKFVQGLAGKFPKSARVIQAIKSGSGKAGRFAKNNKFLTLAAALTAFHYTMGDDGNIVSDNTTATGSDQKVDKDKIQSDQKADDSASISKLSKPGWDTNFTGVVGGGNISGYKSDADKPTATPATATPATATPAAAPATPTSDKSSEKKPDELDQVKKNAGIKVDANAVFSQWGGLTTSPKTWLKSLPLNAITIDDLIDKLGDPPSMKTIGSTTYMKYKWGTTHSSITFFVKGDIVVDARFDPEWQELDKISHPDNLPSNAGQAMANTVRLTKGFSSDKTSMWNTEPVTAKQMQGK